MLQQNKALMARLHRLESSLGPDVRSVKFMDDSSSSFSPSRMSRMSTYSTNIVSAAIPRRIASSIARFSVLSFEAALQNSRVYNRNEMNDSDVSFTTSTAPTNAWSMLSGLSLNDISIISVFRLPLSLDDLNAFAMGTTFSSLLSQQPEVPGSTTAGAQAEASASTRKNQPIRDERRESVGDTLNLTRGYQATTGPLASALLWSLPRNLLRRRDGYSITQIPSLK